ncbi:MAG: LysM peptidoglycan-binding domain-containing protein [Burkholderiaceae bacterium]|jgi:hypothetical protein|nr:LysM peptidoglycan-binding domain-containing protein [Burkholderiaceae bacterium]
MRTSVLSLGLLAIVSQAALPAHAQQGGHNFITPGQRATAQQVAGQGVPLSALAPDAPNAYTVRSGDTLWRISGMFLKSPWRWPELWGMNLQDLRNPHLIYPGQQLQLERDGDRAWLRTRSNEAGDTVRVSPRNRIEKLGDGPLPTLQPQLIEPFLTEPLVVNDDTFARAPRIVALANPNRVMVARGDRAYARGPQDAPLLKGPGLPSAFRVFRTATPLKDPVTGAILGYEGQYVGQAELVRGESQAEDNTSAAVAAPSMPAAGNLNSPETAHSRTSSQSQLPVPATIDITNSKEEMRAGDRLIAEPPRDFRSYIPHAPQVPMDARVVRVHGNAVRYVGQNQIVVINKGLEDGIENGHVLALLSSGAQMVDKTDEQHARIKLPDERNGLVLVFRPFERVSYALVMEITSPVQVGDRLVNPK